jgi:hypothetical protein
MCSSSGKMPKKCYQYISMSLQVLLTALQSEREKNAPAVIAFQILRKNALISGVRLKLEMKHTGLLPRDQENRALGAPLHLQKICSRH